MPRDKLPKKDAQAAKRLGELQESYDPGISEWGNPVLVMFDDHVMNT